MPPRDRFRAGSAFVANGRNLNAFNVEHALYGSGTSHSKTDKTDSDRWNFWSPITGHIYV
jgi:hypothetical protein